MDKVGSERQRLTWGDRVAAGGLYGYTKAVQAVCESCTRKVARSAESIAARIYAKDPDVVSFLQTHAKRGKSRSARVLLSAMKNIGPRVASTAREAGAPDYGMYGFKAKTADLALSACAELKATAGRYAADLHRRRAAEHERIVGFFREHSKQGRCAYSGMLLSCYPDPDVRMASVAPPSTTSEWLAWDED